MAGHRKSIIYTNIGNGNCPEDEDHSGGCDCNEIFFEDERINLNKQVDGRIILLGSLGFWDGRKQGVLVLDNNVRSILDFNNCPLGEWYGDGYNIRSRLVHHDGTLFIEYRIIREDRNIDNLISWVLSSGDSPPRDMVNRYTRSLYPTVADIYGWRRR